MLGITSTDEYTLVELPLFLGEYLLSITLDNYYNFHGQIISLEGFLLLRAFCYYLGFSCVFTGLFWLLQLSKYILKACIRKLNARRALRSRKARRKAKAGDILQTENHPFAHQAAPICRYQNILYTNFKTNDGQKICICLNVTAVDHEPVLHSFWCSKPTKSIAVSKCPFQVTYVDPDRNVLLIGMKLISGPEVVLLVVAMRTDHGWVMKGQQVEGQKFHRFRTL